MNATSLLRQSFAQRMRDATPALRGSFVAYLDRLTATHSRGTVTGTATRLNHFAAHLGRGRPRTTVSGWAGPAPPHRDPPDRDRRATNSRTGAPIQASERRGRVLTVHCLLNDIAEWGLAASTRAPPSVSLAALVENPFPPDRAAYRQLRPRHQALW